MSKKALTAFNKFVQSKVARGGVGGQVVGCETYSLRFSGHDEGEVWDAISDLTAQRDKLVGALLEIIKSGADDTEDALEVIIAKEALEETAND